MKDWKAATRSVTGLSGVHGLQSALHLPEMMGDAGFDAIVAVLEQHYAKDENTNAFQTWKEFKSLKRDDTQTVANFIMQYEQYKSKMKRFKMDLTERIHGLNLLCSANLSDDALRICMREVDADQPDQMFENAKKALKKYYGVSAVSSAMLATSISSKEAVSKSYVKQEDDADYESFVAWKKSNRSKKGEKSGLFRGRRTPMEVMAILCNAASAGQLHILPKTAPTLTSLKM